LKSVVRVDAATTCFKKTFAITNVKPCHSQNRPEAVHGSHQWYTNANATDAARKVFTSAHGHGLRAVEPCKIFACEHMLYTKNNVAQQQD